jgi:hypothetical protein
MENYQTVSNGLIMWLACAPSVLLVLFQAFIFFKRSRQEAANLNMDPKQIKISMRSAAVSSIGPCLVILATLLSLIQYVGTPLAWMRCGIIGSAQAEVLADTIAANGMGINLKEALPSNTLTIEFLSTASMVMGIGVFGYIILSGLFADKTEVISRKFTGGKAALLPIVSTGAIIGGFSNLTVGQALPWGHGGYAIISAAAIMFTLQLLIKKYKAAWLKEWCLTISMFAGMMSAYGISVISGLSSI